MIRLLAAWTRIAVVAVSMAMSIPAITFAQTPESATESEPTAGDNASPVQAASGPEDNTSVETNPPARSTSPSEVEAENQRLINELRSELLDDRADYIDRWLSVIGVVLTFFGIVVAIVGVWGFRKFQKIETEAKNILGEIKKTRDKSLDILQDLNAEAAAENPAKANQAVKNTREDPGASLTGKAIANALDLQQHGRNKEAIKKWRAIAHVVEGSDNDLAARAWFSVGYLLHQDNDFKNSIVAYDTAIHLKPDHADTYNNRGVAQSALNQHEAAISDFDTAIRLDPDLVTAFNNRGIAKNALGGHEDAIIDYNRAIRLDPDLVTAFNNRGIAKNALGGHEDAIIDYNRAIHLKPDFAEAFNNRGNAKADSGQYAAAIADYDEAIHLKPDFAEAFNNRGASKAALKQYGDAIADCDTAIRLKPDLVTAFNNRGNAKADSGKYAAAITDFDEAIHLKPDYAGAYINRGIAKVKLNLKDEARKDFEIALELAENAGDTSLQTKAEKWLRDLDAAEGS